MVSYHIVENISWDWFQLLIVRCEGKLQAPNSPIKSFKFIKFQTYIEHFSIFISRGAVADQWCELKFITAYYIERISIWNRIDASDVPERIDGVQVYLDDMLLGKIKYQAGRAVYTYTPQKKGRVIRICCSKVSLAIAELQVFGSLTG